jgi:hypothetical protein
VLRNVEISDPNEMHAARQPGLRNEHSAELAGADQADPDRAAAGYPLLEHGRKVHAVLP